jgi:phosphoglycerate dehydrogenase-like enzyme
VHTIYAGTDNIPWDLVTARNLLVTNSAGVYAPMMAEYVIAMVVMLYRNLHLHALAQREHRQDPRRSLYAENLELYGKRMGILGYGAIGRQLAVAANGLGMHVWALRRTPTIGALEPVERMLESRELPLLLRECDIVVIAASLNSTTRGLLGAEQFAQMKRGAILVNVARGAILDEAALVQSLEQGHLRGAILDVTTVEPLPPDSPLWDAPNLLLTPHISGEMPVGRDRSIELFCKNLQLYLDGQTASLGNLVQMSAHV